jgi:hypothetical protein
MNAIIVRRTALSTLAAFALAAALPTAVSAQNTAKMDVWTVNMTKSTLGPASGTLVLEQQKPPVDTAGYPASHSFLLVSNGKLYLATDNASSGTGAKNAAYSRWTGMKLSQIGNEVKSGDVCGFRCQSGLTDRRPMTIVFKTTAATGDAMRDVNAIAFDKR